MFAEQGAAAVVCDLKPEGMDVGGGTGARYPASKFGGVGCTNTWSRELGPKGIRVNAGAPGFIETTILATIPDKVRQHMREQVPLHRRGKPDEIANVYALLASDEASYIHDAVIEVSWE